MKINITTEYIKLDQLLKFAGIAGSGAEAKYYITEGMIRLNGITELQRGRKIRKGDVVTFGEQEIYVC